MNDSGDIRPKCKNCGASIPLTRLGEKHKTRLFCSMACRRKSHAQAWRELNPSGSVPTGTVGAISELIVCQDLLKRGYEVFRAVSPHCSCDVAVLKNSALLRVEVRTAYENKNGTLAYPKPASSRFDILALVVKGWSVRYIPEL